MSILDDLKSQLKVEQFDKIKEFWENEQSRAYVILGGAAIFVALYMAVFLVPKFGQLSNVSRTVSDLNGKISRLSTSIKRQRQMGQKLKDLRAEYEEYSKRLPKEKEIPEFLEGLASIAKTSKVKILSITPSELVPVEVEGRKEGYYKKMPISITAKSGYHQLGRFVSAIETGKRFITISDISIRYDSNTPRMHNVKMGLTTYVSVEEEKKK
jgi:type IV pilus assembly protein PilO